MELFIFLSWCFNYKLKLCLKHVKRGPQRGNTETSADKMMRIRMNETNDERLLRLQQMRDKRLLRLRIHSPKSKRGLLQEQCNRNLITLRNETQTRERPGYELSRQGSRLLSESPKKTVARCLDLQERQASRLCKETDEEREVRLTDKREGKASRLSKETGEERGVRITDNRERQAELYVKRVKSRIALNFARSKIASDVPDCIVQEHSSGSLTFSCSVCLAKFWESEKLSGSTKLRYKFPLCCGDGKVVLPSIASHPELLMHLLTAADPRGRRFEIRSELTTPLWRLFLLE